MPDFWQFPTVSMGLGPMMAIYQARFVRYLEHRGIVPPSDRKVWAFLGDGEMDEPESLGAITMPVREKLDNLVFVINCNLQRLDGPVRGNGKIIQELEAAFLGAGWNVIKVVWGSRWDPLLARDTKGLLRRLMMECVDGEYQNFKAKGGAYTREHFFGKYPELQRDGRQHVGRRHLAAQSRRSRSAQGLQRVPAAMTHKGQPTVILAKTVKGYGMGKAGEGQNITHQQKKLDDEALQGFPRPLQHPGLRRRDRERAVLPAGRGQRGAASTCTSGAAGARRLPAAAPHQRAAARSAGARGLRAAARSDRRARDLDDDGLRAHPARHPASRTRTSASTSCRSCRTRRAPSAWKACSARSASIRRWASSTRRRMPTSCCITARTRRARSSRRASTRRASMCSWIAAGTAYANHGVSMMPFYIYYSMFGFQRVGDFCWAAGDMQARGFLIGGTAGRTTLAGEGLQHQDGHSQLRRDDDPELRRLRPDVRLRAGGDRAGRPAPHVRRAGERLLLHHLHERELRAPGDAEGRRAGHSQGHVPAAHRRHAARCA